MQATWANRLNPLNARFGLEMLEQRSLFNADLSLATAHIAPPAEFALPAISFSRGFAVVNEDAAPSIREAIRNGATSESEIDYESGTTHTGDAVKVNPEDCVPVAGETINHLPGGINGAMFLAVARGFNPLIGFDVVINLRGLVPGLTPPPVRAPHVPDAPHHPAPPPANDSGVVNDDTTTPAPADDATGGVNVVQAEQLANVLSDSPVPVHNVRHTNPIAAEILETTSQSQAHGAAPVIQATARAGVRGTFISAGETAGVVRTARVLAGAMGGIFAKQLIDTTAQSAAAAIQTATSTPIETVAATVAQIAPASYFIPRLGSPYEFMCDSISTLTDEFAGVPSMLGNVDVEMAADPRRAWFVTAIVIAADVLLLTYVLRQRATRMLQAARI